MQNNVITRISGKETPSCVRDEDFVQLRDENRATVTLLRRLETRITEEFLGVFSSLRRQEEKLDALLAAAPTRPRQLSLLDWDVDEDTALQGPTIWAYRARAAAEQMAGLQAELAAANARLEERERHSDRALVRTARQWKRWQIVGAWVIALLTVLGGGVTLTRVLGLTP